MEGEKSFSEAEREFTWPRNKGSLQNVIQHQVGSLDKYVYLLEFQLFQITSPKFQDINHIKYVVQCAKTFSAFSWTLI